MIPLWWYCPRWVEGKEDTVQMLPFASACLWASLLSLLASAAVRAPEGASGWGLVITGRLQQLFLQHGSSVTVFLHCCLGRCLLCDKSQFLLALKHLNSEVTLEHSAVLNRARGLHGSNNHCGIWLLSHVVAVGILQLFAISLLGQWQLSAWSPPFTPQFSQHKITQSILEKKALPQWNNTAIDGIR